MLPLLPLLALGCGGGAASLRPSALDLALSPIDDRGAYDDPLVQRELDRVTHSQARTGNEVTLLVNHAAFERRLENARGADLLLVKTFQILDDEIGRTVVDLLSERARAGAYVVFQYEVKSSLNGLSGLRDMQKNASIAAPLGELTLIRRLREAGVIVVPTNSPTRAIELSEWQGALECLDRAAEGPAAPRDENGQQGLDAALDRLSQSLQILNYSDHEKYWITGRRRADGAAELRAILGGTNLAYPYARGGLSGKDPKSGKAAWRDTDVEVRGPVVNDIVERFFSLMDYHLGRSQQGAPGAQAELALRGFLNQPQPPCGRARVRFVWNHPLVNNTHAIEELYRVLLQATPRRDLVRIETAYFVPNRRLLDALQAALRRGVRLTVLTNSKASTNHKVVSTGTRATFAALLRTSPRIALLERAPRPDIGEMTLHSKVASFGARGPVLVGSPNLDEQSFAHNSESLLLIDEDDGFRAAFDDMFLRDIAADRADRITQADIDREPPLTRVGDVLSYYLIGYFL